MNSFSQFLDLVSTLHDPKKGCQWDQKQTFETYLPYLIEEVYEVASAIENKDSENLIEELGDVLFGILSYAKMGEKLGLFNMDDIINRAIEKFTRRHPHVFSNNLTGPQKQSSWDLRKAEEKKSTNPLQSIPKGLNAVHYAQKVVERSLRNNLDIESVNAKQKHSLSNLMQCIIDEKKKHLSEDIESELRRYVISLQKALEQ